MAIKSNLIWRAKIACKLVLAHLPIPYSFWKRLGLFEHGAMEDPEYVFRIFNRHFQNTNLHGQSGWIGLELGPGDSVASGIIARAHGAKKTYLVDAGAYISEDLSLYIKLIDYIKAQGLSVPDIEEHMNFGDMLNAYGIEYLTEGNKSLEILPDHTIDFCWSQAVLEHVRVDEFDEMAEHLKRLTAPNGVNSHRVDLKDHLVASLNNMRFSHRVWESRFFAESGFYTNRLRMSAILEKFKAVEFKVEVQEANRWEKLPLPKSKLHNEFSHYTEEDLKISGFQFVATS